jgi:RimJ/RimL family protein N-acetyltransferase
MEEHRVSLIEYHPSHAPELLRLLLELHNTYFHQSASSQIQQLRAETNMEQAYKEYIEQINENEDGSWKIYLAASGDRIVGYIIGSIEKDESLVYNTIGKLEDWYVEEAYREKGVGGELYHKLEEWYREKECQQVLSDTWQDNMSSINAHKKLGFFVSGIMFGKILK